jgi:hypothetical protein
MFAVNEISRDKNFSGIRLIFPITARAFVQPFDLSVCIHMVCVVSGWQSCGSGLKFYLA